MVKSKSSIFSALGGDAKWPTIYTLVFSIYTIAFALQLNVSIIRISYALYFALSIWFIAQLFTSSKQQGTFFNSINLFTALIIVYGLLLVLTGTTGWQREIDSSGYLKSHIPSVIPLYVFYYFGKQGKITTQWFSVMLLVFFLDAFLLFTYNQAQSLEAIQNAEEGFTNNAGYIWASLLPVVAFMYKRKLLQFVGIGIIAIFVVACFKRGAILIATIMILYFVLQRMKKGRITIKIVIVLFTIILIAFLFNYFEKLLETSDYLNLRLERTLEGDTSGREDIYAFFGKYFFSSENGLNIIWGNGAFSTVRIYGIEAHNDWLEYAIDMGMIGMICYIVYWLRVIKNYLYSRSRLQEEVVIAMGMVVILNLLRTIFSMSFSDMSFFSAIVMGYTMSLADKEKQISIKK